MAGQDRTISVLKLFTLDRPAWTVEEVATALGVSASSAYRYVAVLVEAGLLTGASGGRYLLGPGVIQYDRQIQLTDPLLRAARPVMEALQAEAPPGSVVLLCRLFRDTVLCIHQQAAAGDDMRVSYERGRPMPLFRGATSKIILAHLPARELRRLYAAHAGEIDACGLGQDWPAFHANLARMRRAGHVVSHAEVDAGRIGIGVAISDEARRVLGSLSYVIPSGEAEGGTAALAASLRARARAVEAAM